MAKTIHFMSLYLFCEKASKGKLLWFRNKFCFILPTCIIQSKLPLKLRDRTCIIQPEFSMIGTICSVPAVSAQLSFFKSHPDDVRQVCGRPSNPDIPATASEALLLTATSISASSGAAFFRGIFTNNDVQLTQAPVGDRLVPQLRQEWTLFQQRSTFQNTLADLTTRLGLQYMFSAMGQKFLLTPIYVNPFFL